jgi:hypothetical protein
LREPPTQLKVKEPWDFKKSVFASYQQDTEQILLSCFEFDWECSKISKIVKSSQDLGQVKTFLRDNYKNLRDTYKYYAAILPNNGVFSIGSLIFQEIVNGLQIVDKETCKQADVDMEFITTNAGVK